MTEQNPIFKRRPTDQEIAAYKQAGLLRVLAERYPKWAMEEGYIRKKEAEPGFFSRLFGRDEGPSLEIDEEAFRQRSRDRARQERRMAREEVLRQQEGARRFARGDARKPAPSAPAIVVEESESASAPQTANELASEISDKVASQDIQEALATPEVQESIVTSDQISETVVVENAATPKETKRSEDYVNVSTGNKAAPPQKESAPATQSATGQRSKRQKVNPSIKEIIDLFPKGSWILAFIEYEDGGKMVTFPLFFIKSLIFKGKSPSIEKEPYANAVGRLIGRDRKLSSIKPEGDRFQLSADIEQKQSVLLSSAPIRSSRTGNPGTLFLARKGLFQQRKHDSNVVDLAERILAGWPGSSGNRDKIEEYKIGALARPETASRGTRRSMESPSDRKKLSARADRMLGQDAVAADFDRPPQEAEVDETAEVVEAAVVQAPPQRPKGRMRSRRPQANPVHGKMKSRRRGK